MTLTLPVRYGTTSDFIDTRSPTSILPVSPQFDTINIQSFSTGKEQLIVIKYTMKQPSGCISNCYFYGSSDKLSFEIGKLNNPVSAVPVSGFSLKT
jgi:hypothetical protein